MYRAADIRADTITLVRESPARLAPEFVKQLEDAGESGMGYTVFAIVFKRRWWRSSEKFFFVGGSPFDFPPWPDGLTNANVVSIHPHEQPRDTHKVIHIDTMSMEYCVAKGPPSSDG